MGKLIDDLLNMWRLTRAPIQESEVNICELAETIIDDFRRDDPDRMATADGFDMAYVSKLFVPFHRLHCEAEFPGNGFGPGIAARIIHRHGGDISAEASLGKGTTITFSL